MSRRAPAPIPPLPMSPVLAPNIGVGAPGAVGPASAWGTIPGTLSDQTDLQGALDTKVSFGPWDGDPSFMLVNPQNGIGFVGTGGGIMQLYTAESDGSVSGSNSDWSRYWQVGGPPTVNGRTPVFATIGWEFTATPYVGADAMWHGGNLPIPGPFTDDAAAATGGVAVGECYLKGAKLATRLA